MKYAAHMLGIGDKDCFDPALALAGFIRRLSLCPAARTDYPKAQTDRLIKPILPSSTSPTPRAHTPDKHFLPRTATKRPPLKPKAEVLLLTFSAHYCLELAESFEGGVEGFVFLREVKSDYVVDVLLEE